MSMGRGKRAERIDWEGDLTFASRETRKARAGEHRDQGQGPNMGKEWERKGEISKQMRLRRNGRNGGAGTHWNGRGANKRNQWKGWEKGRLWKREAGDGRGTTEGQRVGSSAIPETTKGTRRSGQLESEQARGRGNKEHRGGRERRTVGFGNKSREQQGTNGARGLQGEGVRKQGENSNRGKTSNGANTCPAAQPRPRPPRSLGTSNMYRATWRVQEGLRRRVGRHFKGEGVRGRVGGWERETPSTAWTPPLFPKCTDGRARGDRVRHRHCSTDDGAEAHRNVKRRGQAAKSPSVARRRRGPPPAASLGRREPSDEFYGHSGGATAATDKEEAGTKITSLDMYTDNQ